MTDTYILTDIKNRIWKENFNLSPENENWSVNKFVLNGGQASGMDIIEINNGTLSFSILPTRGMGIWRGNYKGNTLGWDSPVHGPVNPSHINLDSENGIGWLAGFDELIVRCGLANNGAPGVDVIHHADGKTHETVLPLHGKIANIPAHFVSVEIEESHPQKISIIGEVDEAMLFMPHLRLRTRIETVVGSNSIKIIDEVVNCGTSETEIELLYHCNFGSPFLEKGSELVAPVCEVAPRDEIAVSGAENYFLCDESAVGFEEKVYFYDLAADEKENTVVMLKNKSADKAVALRFNKTELPWFTFWKNTAAVEDGYVVGLEPGTDFPNNRSFERECGRVKKVLPGGSYKINLEMEIFDDAAIVTRIENEISEIQKNNVPKTHLNPITKFSKL
ncbi:MAG: DUF4432 domain-containing protein [Chlamydiae bacterium]|nr:MAG: DUF4432 domain-containing protein [Chlamydiota bacterium]